MRQFFRNNIATAVNYHLPVFISIIVFGYLVSFIFFAQIWSDNNHLLHSTFEILYIFLMLFTFAHVWNAYSESNYFMKWVGFGALIIISLNLPHAVNFADFINMTATLEDSLMDISLKYGVLVSYLEILIWLMLVFYRKSYSVNKWIGLAISMGIAAFFIALIIKLKGYIPEFYSGFSITIFKHYADLVLSFIAVVAFVIYVVKFRSIIDDRGKDIYEYIILALCFFIPSRICFALSWEVTAPMQLFGHIFKLAYYYSIYYGVHKTTVEYPYRKLEKVKDFYEKLLDTSPVGIVNFDFGGAITYISKECNNLFGYDMSYLKGIRLEQLLGFIELYGFGKFELLEKLLKLQEETITFYGRSLFSNNSGEKLIFTAMKLEMGIAFAVKDAKKAQAIENMQLQIQTLLDSTDNVVFLLDINRKIIMCNKKFLEITNKRTCDIVGFDIVELSGILRSNLKDCINTNTYNEEMRSDTKWTIQTLNGDIKKISLDSLPIFDVDNEKIGWIFIGKDISDYENEQAKIIHSEKMAIIGQMAAGLVHEIKNPLASIKGLCQLMLCRSKPEKIAEYAAVMERAVDDIGEIVTGFLQFSKPTSGDFEKVGINSLVNSMEMMISTNAYKHGIKTYFCYSSIDEIVLINSYQIKNAILGIVDNAIDAMNGAIDPKLIISTEHDRVKNTMSISIKDNGLGMTKEQLSCIGTPFYTTKPRGTGLGISVIKYIVNEHEGTLKIDSQFGEGAVFTIILPCIVSSGK